MLAAGKQTGYPSVDKPWLKYYDPTALDYSLPEGTMYDYMHAQNEAYADQVAIEYFNISITYAQLEQNIVSCQKALVSHGIKKGDVIGLFMLNTPELAALYYAANSLGIICTFLVVNTTSEEIKDKIIQTKCRMIFATNLVLEHLLKSAKGTDVERIINVPLSHSLHGIAKCIADLKSPKLKEKYGDVTIKMWKDFLKEAADIGADDIELNHDSHATALYMFTGGSTGISKGCEITNYAGNSVAYGYANSIPILDIKRKETFLSIIPPWLSYGLFCAIHMPLVNGITTIMSPDPSPKVATKLMLTKKINHFTGGPMHLEGIVKSPKAQKMDLSFIKTAGYGGDSFTEEWENDIRTFFDRHGAKNCVIMGYGMSELCGTFCTANHKMASMIPFAQNNIKIVDPDSMEELKFDQEGEILANSPSMMVGYLGYAEETSNVFVELDGEKWLRTGDLGKVTGEGFLKITGRIKRIYCSKDEEGVIGRVYPMKIEAKISEADFVEKVAVVGVRETEDAYVSIAFVVLKGDISNEDARQKLIEKCHNELPFLARPTEYRFVKDFPLTRANKTDYKALEELAKVGDY